MTTASAAVGRNSSASAASASRVSLHRLTLPLAAVVASTALAIGMPKPSTIIAAALAALLALAALFLLRKVSAVAGPRPGPRWYSPAAAVLAAAVLGIRGALDGWSHGAVAGVAALLAVTPGALLMATDVPLWQALRRGNPRGILLHRTDALGSARAVEVVALDGLDTIVDGKVVDHVDPLDETHLRNLRWFGGALAHAFESPLGKAVARLSAAGNLTNVMRHGDLGISGSVDRHPTRIGTLPWIGLEPVDSPWEVIAVEVDGRALGTITVADALRAETAEAVAALRAQGLDVRLVAPAGPRIDAVAERAGITTVVATLPSEAAVVSPHAPPARLLLGPAGEDVTVERADIGSAVAALDLCRSTDAAQRRGVRVALGWHGVVLALVASGVLTEWSAAAAAVIGTGVVAAISWAKR